MPLSLFPLTLIDTIIKNCNKNQVMLTNPDYKVHGANMGPIWVLLAHAGPHVGVVNFAIKEELLPWLFYPPPCINVQSMFTTHQLFPSRQNYYLLFSTIARDDPLCQPAQLVMSSGCLSGHDGWMAHRQSDNKLATADWEIAMSICKWYI